MKIPGISRTKLSYDDYVNQLRSQGYRLLGYGAFAQVYAKKGEKNVIKIGYVDNWKYDGYLAFLKAVDPSNSLFPKIRSVQRFYYKEKKWSEIFESEYEALDRYYVVEMERLVSMYKVPHKKQKEVYARHGMQNFHDLCQAGYWWTPPRFKTKRARTAYKILDKLYQTYDEDIHDGNVMFRQSKTGKYELVITDPIAGYLYD